MTNTADPTLPDLETIRAAHDRIRPYIHRTPVATCETLNQIAGRRLMFKCENLQKAGAFKSRGACNAVFSLEADVAARGVVTHSSGNHAGALARAARMRGIPAHIVMPRTAPAIKVAAVQQYGATVHFCEPTLEARESTAGQVQSETGAEFIHPYNDVRVIAGQATCAVEFLEQCPDLDVIMTPVGGGGLLSGTCLAVEALRPELQVIAAEPHNVDDAWRGWKSGTLASTNNARSVADGLLTNLGSLTFPIIREHVDNFVLATEQGIVDAMTLFVTRTKLLIEPSSAVPLAGLIENPEVAAGARVGIILSGGNVDFSRSPSG